MFLKSFCRTTHFDVFFTQRIFWRVLMNVILGHEQSVCLSASRLTSYACLEGFDDLLLMTIFLTIHELRCKDNENYLWVYRFLLFFAHFS